MFLPVECKLLSVFSPCNVTAEKKKNCISKTEGGLFIFGMRLHSLLLLVVCFTLTQTEHYIFMDNKDKYLLKWLRHKFVLFPEIV